MDIVLQTKRLYLRRFTADDVDLIFQLNNDPVVTKYTFDPMTSRQQAEEVLLSVIIPQYQNNLGRWAVYLKEDDTFIGWCGLKLLEDNAIDLGYRFMQKYWRKGYAFESAKAALEYGLNELNLKCITAHSHPDNTGSVRVLEKCGMECKGLYDSDRGPVLSFVAGECNK